MRSLVGVLSLWTTLFFAASAPAEKLLEQNVVARESIEVEADGKKVGMTVMLDNKGNAWVRANFPEGERYVKHGPHTIDRNNAGKFSQFLEIESIFQHDGSVYMIGKRRPFKQNVPDSDPIRTEWIYPKNLSIYQVGTAHGDLPKAPYGRTAAKYVLGGAIYLGLAYAGIETGIETGNGFAWFWGVISALAGPLTAYGGIAGWDGKFDLQTHAWDVELRKRSSDYARVENLRPLKIDESKPWSAENTKLIPERGKARMLATWLKRESCQRSIRSR